MNSQNNYIDLPNRGRSSFTQKGAGASSSVAGCTLSTTAEEMTALNEVASGDLTGHSDKAVIDWIIIGTTSKNIDATGVLW